MMDRFTSMGISNDAEEFLEAARIVRANKPVAFPPVYFLACQGIELCFKAYLRGCGHSDKELRKMGHDLERCAEAAVTVGIERHVRVTEEDLAILAMANPYYRERDFQYSRTGYKRWPHIDALLGLGDRLWQGLREFCVENRGHHFGKSTAVI